MSRQIQVKSINTLEAPLKKIYTEAHRYLESIGFKKTNLVSVTDKDKIIRSFLYTQAGENVILEYKKDMFEEVLKLIFSPMKIKFVYDIILMRFNQLARNDSERIFVYNE